MRLLLLLIVLSTVDAQMQRWKGTMGFTANGPFLAEINHGDLSDCIISCSTGCVAYTFNNDLHTCQLVGAGYTRVTTTSDYVFYEPVNSTSPTRPIQMTPAGSKPSECPTIYYEWSQEAITPKYNISWTLYSWGTGRSYSENPFDGNLTSTLRSSTGKFPWYFISFNRIISVTSVWITAGTIPLENIDVRIGSEFMKKGDYLVSPAVYTRCAFYRGPTDSAGQEVRFDCGSSRGLPGNRLVVQRINRFNESTPLEIAELRLDGYGKVCDPKAPVFP